MLLPDEHQWLFEKVSQLSQSIGIETYVVGGYVRDLAMNRPSKKNDIDFVCTSKGMELATLLKKQWPEASEVVVFKRFGTAMLKYQHLQLEFVNARKESYSPETRNPNVSTGSLADDQRRRDFTINTLAISLNPADYGRLLDPFEGLSDLKNKCIQTPLEPDKTYRDDPLRMFRAVRFAATLGFQISQASIASIIRHRERASILSQERITQELNKILASEKPSIGLALLDKTRLIDALLPEIKQLQGVTEIQGQGHKENFWHTLEVVDKVAEKSSNLWLRWAALLHDIGKYDTKRFDEKLGWTFHGHEFIGSKKVPAIFHRLKLPTASLKYVQKLIRMSARPIPLTQEESSDSGVRRLIFEAGEDLEDLITLGISDITTKNKSLRQRYLRNYEVLRQKIATVEKKDRLRSWTPPVDGIEIMKLFQLPPSREVGILKEQLKNAILDGVIPNERAVAISFLKACRKQA